MEANTLDYMKYLDLIKEKRRVFVVVSLFVMTIFVIVSLSLPDKYEAKTTVFVEENVINNLVKGIAITPSMNSKIKALGVTMLSRTMLGKVIRELDLDAEAGPDFSMDDLTAGYRKLVAIGLDEKRGVFTISMESSIPKLARDFVNTLTRVYIEDSTSSKRKESFAATKFLAEQIKVFKGRIDAAEKEIQEYKQEGGGLLALDEREIRRRIEGYEIKLDQIQIHIDELETVRRLLVRKTPMRARIDMLSRELNVLRSKYTDSHPRIIQIQDEIDGLKVQVKTRGKQELQEVYLTREYQGNQVQINSLHKLRESMKKDSEVQKALLHKIPSAQGYLNDLLRKKENETIIYEKLVSRYGQSEISKHMELQDKSVSYRVLDPAVIPAHPTSPNRPLIILAGIGVGLIAGFGLILLMDIINPTIKSVEELKEMGLSVFAVLPFMNNEKKIAAQQKKDRWFFAFAGGYFSLILCVLALEGVGMIRRFF